MAFLGVYQLIELATMGNSHLSSRGGARRYQLPLRSRCKMHLAVMLSDENERLLTAVSWLCPKECAITHQLQEKVALTKLEITHKAPGLSSFFRIWVTFFWTI